MDFFLNWVSRRRGFPFASFSLRHNIVQSEWKEISIYLWVQKKGHIICATNWKCPCN